MKDEKVTRVLPVKLTDEELLNYANEMATKLEEKDMAERRKKEVVAEYGAKLTSLNAEIISLSNKVKNKEEHRDVDCEWTYRWDISKKELIRNDTLEIIKTEPIADYERQDNLIEDEKED